MKPKIILLVIVVVLIVGAIYYLEKDKVIPTQIVSEQETQTMPEEDMLKEGKYPKAPELTGIVGYLNTNDEEIKISDFRGKVILVDFWTYSCVNCIRTLPYLTAWDEKYKNKGLVIIGVHTPEFEFEKEKENVAEAIDKYKIKYSVVQDNDYATWRAFQNRFWPRKYLIDSDGYIRYDHIGEGAYEETELKIQELLAEIGEDVSGMGTEEEIRKDILPTTPELYAGSLTALARGQFIGNDYESENPTIKEYTLPRKIDKNIIYLDGTWERSVDDLRLINDEGTIALDFTAKEVNIVADAFDVMEIEVYINGKLIQKIEIDKPQLYNVYNGEYGNYRSDLKVKKGFSFNSFTFG